MNIQEIFESLLALDTLDNIDPGEAIDNIGILIDLSMDLKRIDGSFHAIKLAKSLIEQELASLQLSMLYYNLGNAWANIMQLSKEPENMFWELEQIEKQIIYYRRSINENGFNDLAAEYKCQVLTNLGNLLSHVGRIVEAIELWNKALQLVPTFSMAIGNRGFGLTHYALSLYDERQQEVMLKLAFSDLEEALSGKLTDDGKQAFSHYVHKIMSVVGEQFLQESIDLNNYPLGDSPEEIIYRNWCLNNSLFLNPLNDLGPFHISAYDVLCSPSIVVKIGEGPYYSGFYNQMKQEFVSVRYLYFEGISVRKPHFSDKDVILVNTLDYPVYSLASEKVKCAYRIAYSLLDKIAFFLNRYLGLGIPEKNVSFRTIWYKSQKVKEGIRPDISERTNWPLQGLFWLSKDLYENEADFKEALDPLASEMWQIRNHLEHKYLKLHDFLWPGPQRDAINIGLTDTLAFSLYRDEFEKKALKLLKMVRAALIYLSLSIHSEEITRAVKRDSISPIVPLHLDTWEDDWKY